MVALSLICSVAHVALCSTGNPLRTEEECVSITALRQRYARMCTLILTVWSITSCVSMCTAHLLHSGKHENIRMAQHLEVFYYSPLYKSEFIKAALR